MDSAVVGVLGTLAGTLLGYGLTLLQESRRWEREDRQRREDLRRVLYRDALAHLVSISLSPKVEMEQMAEFSRVNAEIQLFCDSEAVQSALRRVTELSVKMIPMQKPVTEEVLKDFIDARTRLIEAARADLLDTRKRSRLKG